MDPHWQKKAFCAGANPDIFDDPELLETARAYCRMCRVQPDCLEFALSFPEVYGVWAGTTEAERRSLKRGGPRASCPGCANQSIFSDGYSEICIACGLSWLA